MSSDNHQNRPHTLGPRFGLGLLGLVVVIALLLPTPSMFQYRVFRVILALGAAVVAAYIPGLIWTRVRNWVRASGAIAVFVIVYFYDSSYSQADANLYHTHSEQETTIDSLWTAPDTNFRSDASPID